MHCFEWSCFTCTSYSPAFCGIAHSGHSRFLVVNVVVLSSLIGPYDVTDGLGGIVLVEVASSELMLVSGVGLSEFAGVGWAGIIGADDGPGIVVIIKIKVVQEI